MLIWDDAYGLCQSLGVDSSADALSFFKQMLNLGYKYILADLGRPVTERTQTGSSVASQRSYQVPPDFLWPKSVTYTSGSTVYILEEEESQEMWDIRTSHTQTGIPTHFFVRPRFGVGGTELLLDPIPSSSNDTITIIYEATDKDLARDKYTDGTVAVTTGSATITGTATTWIAPMVGRYFKITAETGDNMYYRIATFSSTTSMTLDNVYEGTTVNGVAYQIAEAFNLPEEMQILPVYYALKHYFAWKRDALQEAKYTQEFAAGLALAKKRYATKSRSNIIRPKYGLAGTSLVYPSHFPQTITGS